MAAFGGSLTAAVFSVSNVYFWQHSSYFDVSSDLAPLLHTWSLGVEEQFYFFYPLALVVLAGWLTRKTWIALLAIGLGSFALNLMFQDGYVAVLEPWPKVVELFRSGPTTIFYLSPFRVFEFMIGALIVYLPALLHRRTADATAIAGIALIGVSVATLSSKVLFPSWNALLPCLGAAAVIYGGASGLSCALLGNPVASYLGRISYSLYLIHWPLIVFCRHLFGDITPSVATAIIIASLASAMMMHRFIESPFRVASNYRDWPIRVSCAMGAIATLALAIVSYSATQDGLRWRLAADALAMAPDWSDRGDIMGSIGCNSKPCEFGNPASKKVILVVGDSHADQYTKALNKMYGNEYRFLLAEASSCYIGHKLVSNRPGHSNEPCRKANEAAKEWLRRGDVQTVIHSQAWYGYFGNMLSESGSPLTYPNMDAMYAAQLTDVAALYADLHAPVVIVGPSMVTNISCYQRPTYLTLPCPIDDHYFSYVKSWSEKVKEFARAHHRFQIVIPSDTICPNGRCRITDDSGAVLYTDRQHLSEAGAALIVPGIMGAVASTLQVSER
jgi:peptidoglycan/LPS O-acetylase OafA/YrhL